MTLAKVGALFAFSILVACNRSSDRDAEGPPYASADARYADDDATLQPASRTTRSASRSIAEARCAREIRCDNVGPDEKYSSSEDCLARVSNDWKDDLNARECPGGVDQTQFQQCLTAIRAEECSSPLDTLERVTECTASAICVEDAARD